MDKSCKLRGSLTNQQWEINFIINLVCALTNLIGIGPGLRPEAKKYRAEFGRVMQWELLPSPAILDWLHVVLILWHKAQGLSISPARLSASINEHNITNVNKKGFANLKSLTIIFKLSLKFFFLVPFKKKSLLPISSLWVTSFSPSSSWNLHYTFLSALLQKTFPIRSTKSLAHAPKISSVVPHA